MYIINIIKGVKVKRILINNGLLRELISFTFINYLGFKRYKIKKLIYLKIINNLLILIKYYIIMLIIIRGIIIII